MENCRMQQAAFPSSTSPPANLALNTQKQYNLAMKYLFVDESGDHNLLPQHIDSTFPIFLLTGVVFEKIEYKKACTALIKLKQKVFKTKKVILHARELTRTSYTKQKEFRSLANPKIRKDFYTLLNNFFANFEFSIISFFIDKPWYAKNLPTSPPDPYFLGFSYILGVFEEELNPREKGEIFVERRNNILDKQFLLAWESARVTRVGLVTNKKLKDHKILKPVILKKSWEECGLEIADLISYRLSRHFMGKKEKPIGNEVDIKVISRKKTIFSGLPSIPGAK